MSSIIIRVIGAEEVSEKLQSISNKIGFAVERALDKAAGILYRKVRDRTPVRTGETVKTLQVISKPGVRIIGSKSPVYAYLEYGTSPHEIYPVRALALRWEDIYGVHFAKHVHHPGTKPLHIFRNSVEESKDEIRNAIVSVLKVNLK